MTDEPKPPFPPFDQAAAVKKWLASSIVLKSREA